jgi:choline monooxygenase
MADDIGCAETLPADVDDEEVIESVQHGVRSRLYDRGRYSPRREAGTHHFHKLLACFLND